LLAPDRVARIRKSVDTISDLVMFDDNWYETTVKPTLIFSSAAMEHVDDPDQAYATMHAILALGGHVAHSIDYSSHHTAPGWEAHWTFSDWAWRIVRGKSKYFINRWTHEQHRQEIAKHFDILIDEPTEKPSDVFTTYPYNVSQGYFLARKST